MNRFVKGLLIFVLGVIPGAAVGVAGAFFWFPFVFPPPPAAEVVTKQDGPKIVATGTFTARDRIHWGRGKFSVYPKAVFLEADFEVGPGPDYYVYLVPNPDVKRNADVTGAKFVDLGQLRAFKGSQRYAIPDGVNLADYGSVVIWCKSFSELISPAKIVANP